LNLLAIGEWLTRAFWPAWSQKSRKPENSNRLLPPNRIFDEALNLAPWNDSLRAWLYAQHEYIALTQRDPSERAYLMRRANSLYATKEGQ